MTRKIPRRSVQRPLHRYLFAPYMAAVIEDMNWRLASFRKACESCRNRKVKCDEERPKCGVCVRLNAKCEYREPNPTKGISPPVCTVFSTALQRFTVSAVNVFHDHYHSLVLADHCCAIALERITHLYGSQILSCQSKIKSTS